MTEDSPKTVSIETSLELSEFPSEFPSEFADEAAFPSEAGPSVAAAAQAPVPPVPAGTTSTLPDPVTRLGPSPFVAPSHAAVAETTSQASDNEEPDDDLHAEPVQPSAHPRPATVTDFPVRQHTPAAVALPTLPAGTATLVDLIERRGGLDWREAVAVIHQICLYLKDHSPQSPILLDPRTIQITERGEVHLLSGQTSSDPLVIQVGRLLRTMLMGKEAPPELRLLLSQATFELPIFESIEDVDRALAQLNKLDEPGPAGLALLRAVAAPPQAPAPEENFGHRPPPIRPILPMQRNQGRRSRARTTGLGSLFGSYSSHVAVIFAAIAVIGILLLTRPAMLFPSDAPATTDAVPVATATVPTPGPESVASAATTGTVTPPSSEPGRRTAGGGAGPSVSSGIGSPVPSNVEARVPSHTGAAVPSNAEAGSAPPVRRPPAASRDNEGVVTITPIEGRPTDGNGTGTSGTGRPPAVRTAPAVSARESQRRAAELLRQGEADAASRAFDALVMSNPLYEPRTSDLNPEAMAAFRASQRLILPVKAQRNFELATAALAAGDADRALALANEARAIIDRRLVDTPPQLREELNALIARANEAIAVTNEVVYTEADTDVVPPRQLTTQLPIMGPIGVPPHRVGWLDMIIGRDGRVERVKLNTPLNRHHERMIVSPAKAWKYRPATKNGRPVRYRIMVKVNLPESGTDF